MRSESMTVEEFSKLLKDNLQGRLAEQYPGIELESKHVTGVGFPGYEGIVIKPADVNVGTVINVEPFFEEMSEGMTFDEILYRARDAVISKLSDIPLISTERMTDYGQMQKQYSIRPLFNVLADMNPVFADATQMVVWAILHDYGIKDQKGEDAGLDIATMQPVAGYEDCFNMMRKLYNDAKYFASKQANGTSEDPWYVMENPDYKLILQGKTDVPFFITSAEEPIYTLDVKGASNANDATVQLFKKNYGDNQQWMLEKSEEDGCYYFKNVKSGKYLEVEGDGGANGDDIQQHSKNGSDGQKWKIIASSDGTVQFAPKVAPEKRIDIKSGVFVNGTNVQLYKANNSKAQQFRCEPADVRVKNVSDDIPCLDHVIIGGGTIPVQGRT